MKIDELINKLQNTLNNKPINKNDLSIKTTNLLNELLETLKIIENCACCKDEKIDDYNDDYNQWITFNEFKNIEYLAKGSFGEVHKATWINGYYGYNDYIVVLKRIYNKSSDDKIVDILKEVK